MWSITQLPTLCKAPTYARGISTNKVVHIARIHTSEVPPTRNTEYQSNRLGDKRKKYCAFEKRISSLKQSKPMIMGAETTIHYYHVIAFK